MLAGLYLGTALLQTYVFQSMLSLLTIEILSTAIFNLFSNRVNFSSTGKQIKI